LSGEPGIGKSALLEALREAAGEQVVLAAVGVEQEMALPYAGLDRILRPVLDGLHDLGERERGALETALGLGGDASAEPLLVRLAAPELLSAQGPLLIVVDDLHWADDATRTVLSFLGRHLATEQILLLAAMRDGYGVEPVGDELPIAGLDRDAASALLE